MLETCRELQINKHIEKNLCFKLDNYQESLHDARSTKHLIKHTLCRFYKSRQASSEFSHNVSSFVPSGAFIMQHFLKDLTMPTTSSTSTHTSPFRVLSVRKFLRRNSGHRSNNKHWRISLHRWILVTLKLPHIFSLQIPSYAVHVTTYNESFKNGNVQILGISYVAFFVFPVQWLVLRTWRFSLHCSHRAI